jgi:hypothetical protein
MKASFQESSDPRVAGHWLYWQPIGGRPFVAYDLETGQFLTIATPGANESFDSAAIYNNVAAWSRNLDFGSGKPTDHILEWRTLR